MDLDVIGRILSTGFGDRVLTGMVLGLLNNVTSGRVYEYIRDNINIGYWVTDNDWQKYQKMTQNANVKGITKDDIIAELKKNRIDILGVIINTNGGNEWLDTQIEMLKEKLGLN